MREYTASYRQVLTTETTIYAEDREEADRIAAAWAVDCASGADERTVIKDSLRVREQTPYTEPCKELLTGKYPGICLLPLNHAGPHVLYRAPDPG